MADAITVTVTPRARIYPIEDSVAPPSFSIVISSLVTRPLPQDT